MLNTTTHAASETIPTRDPAQLLNIIDELQKDNNILHQKVYYLTHKPKSKLESGAYSAELSCPALDFFIRLSYWTR